MPRQTREPWWGYCKYIIRQYPRLKAELETPLEPSITPAYGGIGGGSGGISRPVENAVIHSLNPRDQKKYDAVEQALTKTLTMKDGPDRINVINLVYFRQTHTIAGAAMHIHVSENTAGRWNGDFIRLVAEYLEL